MYFILQVEDIHILRRNIISMKSTENKKNYILMLEQYSKHKDQLFNEKLIVKWIKRGQRVCLV